MKKTILKLAGVLATCALGVSTIACVLPNNPNNDLTDDKNNEQLVPTNPNGPSVDEPTTPQQPTNPDIQDPEEKDPEEQNPSVDPQNPEEKDPEVDPQNPDVDPQEPDIDNPGPQEPDIDPQEPDVDPEQPENPGGQVDTENLPTAEDYVNFENKLKEVICKAGTLSSIKEILAYNIKDKKISVLFETPLTLKYVQITTTVDNLDTHENYVTATKKLNQYLVNSLYNLDFPKATTDFTLSNGFTYSADEGYVTGDNFIAELCGVEKPLRTYISNFLAGSAFNSTFSTNYGTTTYALVLYENENEICLKKAEFYVEYDNRYSTLDKYNNLTDPAKHVLHEVTDFIFGENLKPQENSQVEQLSNEYGVIFSKEDLSILEQVRAEIRFAKKPKKAEENLNQEYLEEYFIEETNENKAE